MLLAFSCDGLRTKELVAGRPQFWRTGLVTLPRHEACGGSHVGTACLLERCVKVVAYKQAASVLLSVDVPGCDSTIQEVDD